MQLNFSDSSSFIWQYSCFIKVLICYGYLNLADKIITKNPKSNCGEMSIFDLSQNPKFLETVNPNVIMVGSNFSRTIEKKAFINFHDKRPQGQDYKIRYALRDTDFYGAYMTDIIKDFE